MLQLPHFNRFGSLYAVRRRLQRGDQRTTRVHGWQLAILIVNYINRFTSARTAKKLKAAPGHVIRRPCRKVNSRYTSPIRETRSGCSLAPEAPHSIVRGSLQETVQRQPRDAAEVKEGEACLGAEVLLDIQVESQCGDSPGIGEAKVAN